MSRTATPELRVYTAKALLHMSSVLTLYMPALQCEWNRVAAVIEIMKVAGAVSQD